MKWNPNFFARLWVTFRTTIRTFNAENYLRYCASLSYYIELALFLIITISLFGKFFGKQAMEGGIFSEILSLVGDIAAMQIRQMIRHVVSEQGSLVAKIAAIIVVAFGILAVFTEVQVAINHIWKLKPIPKLSRKKYLLQAPEFLWHLQLTGYLLPLLWRCYLHSCSNMMYPTEK